MKDRGGGVSSICENGCVSSLALVLMMIVFARRLPAEVSSAA